MERARTELLRNIGFEQDKLQQESGIIFAVHSANVQYKKPARFNDELNVVTSLTSLGKASIHFNQSVFLQASHHENAPVGSLLCDAEIKIACINAEKFSPQIIPASIIHKINHKLTEEPESGS
jgi:acyl-CoA thioester hydrolase